MLDAHSPDLAGRALALGEEHLAVDLGRLAGVPALHDEVVLLARPLDENVELSDERYVRDIRAAEDLMRGAPAGTYVLTYNGFGGQVPASYDRLRSDYNLPEVLRLWRKTSP